MAKEKLVAKGQLVVSGKHGGTGGGGAGGTEKAGSL